jgi:predicted NBD/HSP70 family sugar kinase
VFGGGVTARLGDRFIAPIRKVAYANLVNKQNARTVRIVAGALGDNAGIVGAAVLAKNALG